MSTDEKVVMLKLTGTALPYDGVMKSIQSGIGEYLMTGTSNCTKDHVVGTEPMVKGAGDTVSEVPAPMREVMAENSRALGSLTRKSACSDSGKPKVKE